MLNKILQNLNLYPSERNCKGGVVILDPRAIIDWQKNIIKGEQCQSKFPTTII